MLEGGAVADAEVSPWRDGADGRSGHGNEGARPRISGTNGARKAEALIRVAREMPKQIP